MTDGVRRRRLDSRGAVELLPLLLLLVAGGGLLVAHAAMVVDTRRVLVSASREAARAYVEADAADAADRAAARAVGRVLTVQAPGLDDASVHRVSGRFRRCGAVTFRAEAHVPAVTLPWVGELGAVRVRADHTEIVDPYRSGPDGVADCG